VPVRDFCGMHTSRRDTLEGRPLATLGFRLDGERLVGTFHGRHFRFAFDPTRLDGYHSIEPSPRTWQRAN